VKRPIAIAGVASAMLVLGASAALAEGSWTSSTTDVLTSFDSRSWTGTNNDAAHTVITFEGCTDPLRGGTGANTKI